MNSNTVKSTGGNNNHHSLTSINFTTTTINCTTTTTATTTVTTTTNTTCTTTTTTTNNNNNVTTNTILSKFTDHATYFAVVSDTCAFNRNLCKTRYSRLPFLDLATQISQRPAPWLYHTSREYSRESPAKDPHVYLRFPRYRWHLDYQSPNKKRKTANQKLWCTLQNGLKALGIPSDLVPVVTKRAYSIAGLSIPSSLANYLDVINPRVSTTGNHTNTTANNSSNSNISSTNTTNRSQYSHFTGANNNNNAIQMHSNSFQRKLPNDNHTHDALLINSSSSTATTTATGLLHNDEEPSQDSIIIGGGDDATTKRIHKNNHRTNVDHVHLFDNQHVLLLNKSDYTAKTYDLDNISEDTDHQHRDYNVVSRQQDVDDDRQDDGEDDDDENSDEIGEAMDNPDDDDNDADGDDTDWLTTTGQRRRKIGGGGNLGSSSGNGTTTNGLTTMSGNERRGKTRSSVYSLKATKYNRKMMNRSAQNFPALNSRLTGGASSGGAGGGGARRFTKRHLGRPFSGRFRANDSRMDDLSYTSIANQSGPTVAGGRRGSRAISRLGTRHISDSLKTLQRYGVVREKLNDCNVDAWDVDNEPGYQLNAATPIMDENKFISDCHVSLDDDQHQHRLNTSNFFTSSSSSSANSLYHHTSYRPNDDHRSLTGMYELSMQNRFHSEQSQLQQQQQQQSKFMHSPATPMNYSHFMHVNHQSNLSGTSLSISSSCIDSSATVAASFPMDSCRLSEQSNNHHASASALPPSSSSSSSSYRYDSSNDYMMRISSGDLSNHSNSSCSSPQSFLSGRRSNLSKLTNCNDISSTSTSTSTTTATTTTTTTPTMNRYNPLSAASAAAIPVDSFHNNSVFGNLDHVNSNSNHRNIHNANNNSPLPTTHNDMIRMIDDASNHGQIVGDLQTFVNPQTATTTVTFFVCEVCSSRYRSTAGLRYHYHSQHSGYTPQNPISASASRLVVPVGEERGIGGGLRGGRPRRHRGSTASSKSRDKLANSHYANEYQIASSEQDSRSSSSNLSSPYSKTTNPYSPSSQTNKRGHNNNNNNNSSNINRFDCKTLDSTRSIVEPKLIDLIASQPVALKYRDKMTANHHHHHFNSIELSNDNSELPTSSSSMEMNKLSYMHNNTERLSQCSMPPSSLASSTSASTTPTTMIIPGKFNDSKDSMVVVNNNNDSSSSSSSSSSTSMSRYQTVDYNNYSNTTTSTTTTTMNNSSSSNLPHTNIQYNHASRLSSYNSPVSHLGNQNNNSMMNHKTSAPIPHPHHPHHHQHQHPLHHQHSYQNHWNSHNTVFHQMSYSGSGGGVGGGSCTPGVPSSNNHFYSRLSQQQQQQLQHHQSPVTMNRVGPQQRRYERQHCPGRLGLTRSSMMMNNASTMPICDYCLNDDSLMNSRVSGHPEGMLHCSRCGHSAHYTCLRLPPHVIDAALRYPWQCIECKTCWLCNQDDHQDRMIFCWDCDRVFHAHCIIPPTRLPRTTDAHWTCDICLHELYNMNNHHHHHNPSKSIMLDQHAHAPPPAGNSDYVAYANTTPTPTPTPTSTSTATSNTTNTTTTSSSSSSSSSSSNHNNPITNNDSNNDFSALNHNPNGYFTSTTTTTTTTSVQPHHQQHTQNIAPPP
ncbi:unnamed protein product [Schistosoma turkestanicum]|nr:unnamed protein product [Schistosoma turkestanicum]